MPIDLIPRNILLGNPSRAQVTLSPDGQYLAWLAPFEGVMNVWLAPREDLSAASPITQDRGRGIQGYFWCYNNRHLVYVQDRGGNENWLLYAVDVATKTEKLLTPFDNAQARVEKLSHRYPDEIVVSLNHRRPDFHDLYRLNVTTGALALVFENNEFSGFTIDDDLQLRFASRQREDGGQDLLLYKQGHFSPFTTVGYEDSLSTDVLTFTADGEGLFAIDSRGRDTSALVHWRLQDAAVKVLAEDPEADCSDVMIHPLKKTVEGFAATYARKKWHYLDPGVAQDMLHLAAVSGDDCKIISRTLEDDLWIAAFLSDCGPVRYYLFDRKAQKAEYLFSNRESLEGLPLCRMHPMVIPSRDGLRLVSYLTLPRAVDPEQTGQAQQPVPLVLLVHGGPWARDHWGYDAVHQLLANRGYAVLSVNYRGSTGFGKAFINAGDGQWAAKMHDDLLDAVDWAINKGIADKDKIAIMGGSYGGYATLVGLTFTPGVFACGVDIVGPSNLVTLIETIPPYWKPIYRQFVRRIGGDPAHEEGRAFLASRSPLTYVDRIQRPLLIGQGANDPRVKQAESDQIVEAMNRHGIPVVYALYPDEGHGFVRPENRMCFYALTEQFLMKYLGGRAEPIGQDVEKSSVDLKAGDLSALIAS
ncbi:MAG: S9 family peptidase [Holosporales bacterium]